MRRLGACAMMWRVTPDEPAEVIGNLPRSRPSRRSPRRASATDGAAPAKAAATPRAKAAPRKATGAAKAPAKRKAPAKKASPATATGGKVRGVTKTAPARKVAERTKAGAGAKATAPKPAARPPVPPAGYAVPDAAGPRDAGTSIAEVVRSAAQLADAGVGALRSLLRR